MRIDFHAHVVPEPYLALARRGEVPGVRLARSADGEVLEVVGGAETGPVAQRLPLLAVYHDPAARRAAMDAAGVDVHVISPVQFMYHYWLDPRPAADLARVVNDGIAAMVASEPRRFAAMGTLPLQDAAAAVAELHRVHGLGFRAVEIGTHVGGAPLDAPALDPVYRAAEALGIAVFVHPYAPLGRDRIARYYLRNLLGNPFETAVAFSHLVFGGVVERFPRLRLCFAHGGGALPAVVGRLDRGHALEPACRERGARAPGEHLRRCWYDTITHDIAALEALVARVGPSQVLLGSDFPFDIGDPDPVGTVAKLSLDEPSRAAILGGNAARLLGRDA
jgi:aminocarboxymuconate-semialdehyde decarboxylase